MKYVPEPNGFPVCMLLPGVADQLQSNFASDLRAILKTVFMVNASSEEEENDAEEITKRASESSSVEEGVEADEEMEGDQEEEDAEEEKQEQEKSMVLFPLPPEESPTHEAGRVKGFSLFWDEFALITPGPKKRNKFIKSKFPHLFLNQI
jgi:hypothetical protein